MNLHLVRVYSEALNNGDIEHTARTAGTPRITSAIKLINAETAVTGAVLSQYDRRVRPEFVTALKILGR